jgi:hypothetical protein
LPSRWGSLARYAVATMRLPALSVGLGAALALLATSLSSAASPAASHYLVRPDLRLCPSPMCGGAWVRRVNHPLTRCVDGAARPACYVASVTGVAGLPSSARAGSVLVRGRLVPARIDGFPGLGALAASAAWRPAGKLEPHGTTFRVADNGVRCITSPCFSLTAVALEDGGRRTVSELDLGRAGASTADVARAQKAVDGGGLLVTGGVRTVLNAGPAGTGRRLRATQLWLPTR